jgi:large subunit ribosomal protein L18
LDEAESEGKMSQEKTIQVRRVRRKQRVRNSIQGTAERPRLSVFRSSKHVYAQLIDDFAGKTLAAAGTAGKDPYAAYGGNIKAAKSVGKKIAELAKAKGISKVAFDRGYYRYHGRIKALADAAREGGLEF